MKAPTQREVIRDVMLSAHATGAWLTLDELTKLTHFPTPSLSAQLRHLRRMGFTMEKRPRVYSNSGLVWEYCVRAK